MINPFISAWRNEAYEQLEGQIASAKISLANLSSPQLYYVLSGNGFSLDINNPDESKVVCLANNPQKPRFAELSYHSILTASISWLTVSTNRNAV